MRPTSIILTATLALSALSTTALAGEVNIAPIIADRNSAATFNLTGDTAGMNSWQLDQSPRLKLQGFWFRTAGMTREQNIGTLPLAGIQLTDTNPFSDNRADTLAVRYAQPNNQFFIDPTWQVRGAASGSGHADILETIRITNNSTFEPLVISFFQYADFDLSGFGAAPIPDTNVEIDGVLHNTASQSGSGFSLSETVVTPAPTHWQVGFASEMLSMLNDDSTTNLSKNGAPLGPGDLSWAFQWDFVIAPGKSVIISKDKSIIPTPGSMSLIAAGGLLVGARRRRS